MSEALAVEPQQQVRDAGWVLDSGASDHMASRREWFVTYETFASPMPVRIGNRSCIEALGKGNINALMFDGDKWNKNHLVDVLYVPKLKYNLFSLSAVLDKGLQKHSTDEVWALVKDDTPSKNVRHAIRDRRAKAVGVKSGSTGSVRGIGRHAERMAWETCSPNLRTRKAGSRQIPNFNER